VYREATDRFFSLVRTLADTKKLDFGNYYYIFRVENPLESEELPRRAARGACAKAVPVKNSLSGPPAPRGGARYGGADRGRALEVRRP
jgi:hypothetical protein